MSLRSLGRRPGHWATRLSACRYAERFCYLDKQLVLSKIVGTQAMQVIENITYLLDCHAGGRGFESRPLRHFLRSVLERSMRIRKSVTECSRPTDVPAYAKCVAYAAHCPRPGNDPQPTETRRRTSRGANSSTRRPMRGRSGRQPTAATMVWMACAAAGGWVSASRKLCSRASLA